MPRVISSAVQQPAKPGAEDTSFDRQFIDMMVPHHEGGVEMAKLAQARAEHAELKAAVTKSMKSQQEEIDKMRGWRQQWYGSSATPPMQAMPMLPGMTHGAMPDMRKQMDELRQATPFDKAFIDAILPHHQMAVEAAKVAQRDAKHAEVKQLATKIIAEQQKEVEQLKAWRAEWYPDS